MTGKQSLNIIQKNSSAVITFAKPAQQLQPVSTSEGFVGLGGVIPEGSNYVLIEVETVNATPADGIRFLNTGENVTTSFGFRRFDKEFFDIEGAENIAKFKCIDILGSGKVVLNVQFGVKR